MGSAQCGLGRDESFVHLQKGGWEVPGQRELGRAPGAGTSRGARSGRQEGNAGSSQQGWSVRSGRGQGCQWELCCAGPRGEQRGLAAGGEETGGEGSWHTTGPVLGRVGQSHPLAELPLEGAGAWALPASPGMHKGSRERSCITQEMGWMGPSSSDRLCPQSLFRVLASSGLGSCSLPRGRLSLARGSSR